MKKLLVLGLLLGLVPLLLRADVRDTSGAGTLATGRTAVSGIAQAPHKEKKHAKKKAKAVTVALFVTEDGFVPADVKIKKGEAVNLVVTRQTDNTCATSIVIPGYGISRDLPLNVPETISFTPKTGGDINYSCGMGMLHGVLSVE